MSIEAMLELVHATGDRSYCPAARKGLDRLRAVLEPSEDGGLEGPRWYELHTNRRLYLASRDSAANPKLTDNRAELSADVRDKKVNRFRLDPKSAEAKFEAAYAASKPAPPEGTKRGP